MLRTLLDVFLADSMEIQNRMVIDRRSEDEMRFYGGDMQEVITEVLPSDKRYIISGRMLMELTELTVCGLEELRILLES